MLHMSRNTPNRTHAQELIALRTGREPSELLRELYIDKRQSQADIADLLGVSRMTVAMWLREFGIVRSDADGITA